MGVGVFTCETINMARCSAGWQRTDMNINGTTVSLCEKVPVKKDLDALSLGLGIGIPIGTIILIALICHIVSQCYLRSRLVYCDGDNNRGYGNAVSMSNVILQTRPIHNTSPCYVGIPCVPVSQLDKWKTFQTDDEYVRKIACLVEAEDVIPIEVYEFLRDESNEYHDYWNQILMGRTTNVREKNIIAIRALMITGAKHASQTIQAYVGAWKDEVCMVCGREYAYQMIADAEKSAIDACV